ncbi:Protein DJ-1-like B [Vitis vinifera]|uniref:Protein DJ-1-like B n=1 Tax=Vitis vinifera TaxID=29760 RepID=A0A438HCN7_VITVI|nr:Protein DJ-1-like B [Vitis vinifera]
MGRIMSRHLEELATPRISELGAWGGGAFSAGGSQIVVRQQVKMAGHASLVLNAYGSKLMEVVITIDELRRAGVNVIVVPVRKRLQVDACQGVDIVADAPISDCAGADFDLILLPGGMPGATTLGDGDILESMVKKHADDGQLYARFRVAPAVALGSWGLMHGFAFWFDVELNGW